MPVISTIGMWRQGESGIQVRSISLGFIRVCFKRSRTKWYTTKMLTSHVGTARGCRAASHLPLLPFIMTHLPHISNGLLPVGGANVLYSVPLNLFLDGWAKPTGPLNVLPMLTLRWFAHFKIFMIYGWQVLCSLYSWPIEGTIPSINVFSPLIKVKMVTGEKT